MASAPDDVVATVAQKVLACIGDFATGQDGARTALSQMLHDTASRKSSNKGRTKKGTESVGPAWINDPSRVSTTVLLTSLVASRFSNVDFASTALSVINTLLGDGELLSEATTDSKYMDRSRCALHALAASLPYMDKNAMVMCKDAIDALRHPANYRSMSSSSTWMTSAGYLSSLIASYLFSTPERQYRLMSGIQDTFHVMLNRQQAIVNAQDIPGLLVLLAVGFHESFATCGTSNPLMSVCRSLCLYTVTWASQGSGQPHGRTGAQPGIQPDGTCISQGTSRKQDTSIRSTFVGCLSSEQRWWLACMILHSLQSTIAGRVASHRAAGQLTQPARSVPAGGGRLPTWLPYACILLTDLLQYEHELGSGPQGSVIFLTLTAGIEALLAEAAIEELTSQGDAMFGGTPPSTPYSASSTTSSVFAFWSSQSSVSSSGTPKKGPQPLTQWTMQQCMQNVGWHMRLAVLLSTYAPAASRLTLINADATYVRGEVVVPVVQRWKVQAPAHAPADAEGVAATPAPAAAKSTGKGKAKSPGKGAALAAAAAAVPSSPAAPVPGMIVYSPSREHVQSLATAALVALAADFQGASGGVPAAAAPAPAPAAASARSKAVARKGATPSDTAAAAAPPAKKGRKAAAPSSGAASEPLVAVQTPSATISASESAAALSALLTLRSEIQLPPAPFVVPVYKTAPQGALALARVLQEAVFSASQAVALSCVSAKIAPLKPSGTSSSTSGGGAGSQSAAGASSAKEAAEAMAMHNDAMWQLQSSAIPLFRLPEAVGAPDLLVRRAKLALHLVGTFVVPSSIQAASVAALTAAGERAEIVQGLLDLCVSAESFAQIASTFARIAQTYVFYAPTLVGFPPEAFERAKKAAAAEPLSKAYQDSSFAIAFSSRTGASNLPSGATAAHSAASSTRVADVHGFTPPSLDAASTHGRCAYGKDNLLSAAIELMADATNASRYDANGDYSYGSYYGSGSPGAMCEASLPSLATAWSMHCLLSGVHTVLTDVPGLVEGGLEYGQCDPSSLFGWAHAMSSSTTGTSSSTSLHSSKSNAACMALVTTLLHSTTASEVPPSPVGREFPWLSLPSPHAWLQQSPALTQRVVVPSSTSSSSSDAYGRSTSTAQRTMQGPEAAQMRWPTSFHALYMRRRAVQASLQLSCAVLSSSSRSTFSAHLLAARLGADGVLGTAHIPRVSYQLERWGVFAVLRALASVPDIPLVDGKVLPMGDTARSRKDSDVVIIEDGREPTIVASTGAAADVSAGMVPPATVSTARSAAPQLVDLHDDSDGEVEQVTAARAGSEQTSARDTNEVAASYDASQELLEHGHGHDDPEAVDDNDVDVDYDDDDDDDEDDEGSCSEDDEEAYRFSDGESDVDAAETDMSSIVRIEIRSSWLPVVSSLVREGRVDFGQTGSAHCVKHTGPSETETDEIADDILADLADSRPQDFLRKAPSKQVKLLRRAARRCILSYVLTHYPPPVQPPPKPQAAKPSGSAPIPSSSSPFNTAAGSSMPKQLLLMRTAGTILGAGAGSASAMATGSTSATGSVHPYSTDDLAVDVHAMATETMSALEVAGFLPATKRACRGVSPACATGMCMSCVPRPETLSGAVEHLLHASRQPDRMQDLQAGVQALWDRFFTCDPSRTTTVHEFCSQMIASSSFVDGELHDVRAIDQVSLPKALSLIFNRLRKAGLDVFDTSCPASQTCGLYVGGQCYYAPAAKTSVAQSVQPQRKDATVDSILTFLPALRVTALAQAALSKAVLSAPLSLTLRTVVSGAPVPQYNADVRLPASSSASGAGAPTTIHRQHGLKVQDADVLLGPHSNAAAAYECKDLSSLRVPFLFTSQLEAHGVIVSGPGGYNELSSSINLNMHVVGVQADTAGTAESDTRHAGQKRGREDKIANVMDDDEDFTLGQAVKAAKLSTTTSAVSSSNNPSGAPGSSPVPSPGPLDSQVFASLQSAPAVSMAVVEELILRKLPSAVITSLLVNTGAAYSSWATSIVGRTIALHPRHIHSVPPAAKDIPAPTSTAAAAATGTGAGATDGASSASTVAFGGYTGLLKVPDPSQLSDAHSRAMERLDGSFSSARGGTAGARMTSDDYTEQHSAISEEYSRLMMELKSMLTQRVGGTSGGGGDGGEDEEEYDPRAEAEAMAMGLTVAQYRARGYARGGLGSKPAVGVKTLYADMYSPAKGVRPAEKKVGDVPVPLLATVTGFDASRGAHTVVYVLTKGSEDIVLPLSRYTLLRKDVSLEPVSTSTGADSSAAGAPASSSTAPAGTLATSASSTRPQHPPSNPFHGLNDEDMMPVLDDDDDDASLEGQEVEVQAVEASASSAAAQPEAGSGAAGSAPSTTAAAALSGPPASSTPAETSTGPLPTEWNCALCTFANAWSVNVCGMCGTGQPADVRSRKAAVAHGQAVTTAAGGTSTAVAATAAEPDGGPSATDYEWSCTRCTYRQPVTKVIEEDERYGGPSGQPQFESTVKLMSSTNTALYIGLNRRCCMCNMSVPSATLKSAMTKATGSASTADTTLEKLGLASGLPAGGGRAGGSCRPTRVISEENRKAAKLIFLAELNNAIASKSRHPTSRGRYAPAEPGPHVEDGGTDDDDGGMDMTPASFLARIGARVMPLSRSSVLPVSLPPRVRPLYLLSMTGAVQDVRAAWNGAFPDVRAGLKQNRVAATIAACLELDAMTWPGSTHRTTLSSPQRFGGLSAASLRERQLLSLSPVLENIQGNAKVGIGHRVDAMGMSGKWMQATVVGFGVESSKLSDVAAPSGSYPITHALLQYTGMHSPLWYPLASATVRQTSAAAGSSASTQILPELAPVGTHTRDWRGEVLTQGAQELPVAGGQAQAAGGVSSTLSSGGKKLFVEVRHNSVWHIAEVQAVSKGKDFFPESSWVSHSCSLTSLSQLSHALRETPLRIDTAMQFPEARVHVRYLVKPRTGSSLRPGHSGVDPSSGLYIYTDSFALCGDKVGPLGTHIKHHTSAGANAYYPGFSPSEHLATAKGWENSTHYTGRRYDMAFPQTEMRPAGLPRAFPVPGPGAEPSASSSAAGKPAPLKPLQLSKLPLHLRTSMHEDACLASFLWHEEGSRSREFSLAQLVERVIGMEPGRMGSPATAAQALRMFGASEERVPQLKLRFRLWGSRGGVVTAATGSVGDGVLGSHEDLLCANLDSHWTGAPPGASIFSILVDLSSRLAVQAGALPGQVQDWALALARHVLRSPITGLKHTILKAKDYSGASLLSQVSASVLEQKGVHLQVQPVLVMGPVPAGGPTLTQQHTPYTLQPVQERIQAKESALVSVLGQLAVDSSDMLCSWHSMCQDHGEDLRVDAQVAAHTATLHPLFPCDSVRSSWPLILQSVCTNKALMTVTAVQAADTASTSTGRVPLWLTLLCHRVTSNVDKRDSAVQAGGVALARSTPADILPAVLPASTRTTLLSASSFAFIRGMIAGQATNEAYTAIRNLGKVGQRYATYDGVGRPVTQEYKLEPGTVVDLNRVELARGAYIRRTLNPTDSSPSHSYGRSSATGYTGVGVLQKDRVSVSRQNLLDDAHCVLKLHAMGDSARAKLDLMFTDEKAYGSGVSQEFYACVAADLQKLGEQASTSGGSSSNGPSSASPILLDGSSLFYSTASSDALFVTHPQGLHPKPRPQNALARQLYQDRYELIGLAFGKALQDGFVFPLPLSLPFVAGVQAVLGGKAWCGLPAMCKPNAVDATAAQSIIGQILGDDYINTMVQSYFPSMQGLLDLAKRRHAQRVSVSTTPAASEQKDVHGAGTSQLQLVLEGGARVEDLCLSWTDPGSSCNLIRDLQTLSGSDQHSSLSSLFQDTSSIQEQAQFILTVCQHLLGEQRLQALAEDEDGGDVCTEYVDVYMACHLLYLCRIGVWTAVTAFIQGVAVTVTPVHHLLMLAPAELQGLVCGAKTVEWTLESLKAHVQAGGGYVTESRPVHMLLEVLVGMSQEERSEFLRFVTGCPTLPPGGLSSLTPALKVMQKLDIPPPPAWMREAASSPPNSTSLDSAAVGGGVPANFGARTEAHAMQDASTSTAATVEDGADSVTVLGSASRGGTRGGTGIGARKSSKRSAGQTASAGAGEQASIGNEATGDVVDLVSSARSGTKRGRAGTPAREAPCPAKGSAAATSGPTPPTHVGPLSAQALAQLMTSPHDRAFVSASTCFHQVRLPPYSSVAVMRHQLLEAMRASAGLIDFS